MEQGQPSNEQPAAESAAAPSQLESTAVPVEAAAPAPAPEESVESLKAQLEASQERVNRVEETHGRMSAELGSLRAQVQQPAEQPAEAQSAVGVHPIQTLAEAIQYGEPAQIAAAAEQLDAHNRQVAQDVAAPLAQAVGRQVQTRMKFYADNPHLADKEHLVGSIHAAMQESGEFASMSEAQALAEVAKRATAQMAPNVSQEAAPTPPPLAAATAPTQAPESPVEATPAAYDPEVEAAKAAAEERERLLQHQERASSLRVPGGGS